MKKIAILTSGILPVPAVCGGAVENLIDYYLDYNQQHHLHDITVFSVAPPTDKRRQAAAAMRRASDGQQPTGRSHASVSYVFIDCHSPWARLRRKLFGWRHRNDPELYYFYHIEFFLSRVIPHLRRGHFDMIMSENRPGYILQLRRTFPDMPLVLHLHTNLLHPGTPRATEILAGLTRTLTVSRFIADRVRAIVPPADASSHDTTLTAPTSPDATSQVPTSPDTSRPDVRIVYNGIDATLFHPEQRDQALRRSFGFADEDFVVVFSGRLVAAKGIGTLLQALTAIHDPSIKLLVVGSAGFDTPHTDDDFTRELHSRAQQLGGRIRFTGFVPYADIPRHLAVADLAILPSDIDEAFGLTAIEAAAVGLPVVATRDGGLPEALVGQHCILLDKSPVLVDDIIRAIYTVRQHPETFSGNHLPQKFTREAYARAFFDSLP